MNVPADYDDEAERLLTHPDLLPRVKAELMISANYKSILLKSQRKQKRASAYIANDVLFENFLLPVLTLHCVSHAQTLAPHVIFVWH